MINQTDLHRKRIDEGGISISASIRQSLRINFSISNLVMHSGEQFLETVMGRLPEEDMELIKFSQEFWRWWQVQWYRCDCTVYDRPMDVKSWIDAHRKNNESPVLSSLFWANVERFIEDGTQYMLKGGNRD